MDPKASRDIVFTNDYYDLVKLSRARPADVMEKRHWVHL